jgi:hypothetical protein
MPTDNPSYIINISGGAGKNLMFSAVAKNIKKSYPDYNIVVITPYPEILINNPIFHRVYRSGSTPYFYDDIISKHPKNIVSSIEPYGAGGYLLQTEHLIQTWSRLLCDSTEMQMPEYITNYREIEMVRNNLGQITKPILVMNPFGGCWVGGEVAIHRLLEFFLEFLLQRGGFLRGDFPVPDLQQDAVDCFRHGLRDG